MIFYLSCTGNTRWAAEKLADVTNEKMVFIPEAVKGDCKYTLKDGERLGFCLPVHGWRVQKMVKEFLDKLSLDNLHKSTLYCYVCLTAGDSIGEVMEQLSELLHNKGIKVNACCNLIMPESYIGLPFMDVDTDLKEAEKKITAAHTLRKFTDIVMDHRSIMMPLQKGITPKFFSRVLGPVFHNHLITDKKFKLDTQKCIGCGKCVNSCPVGNIKLTDTTPKYPEWLHNGDCFTCFACYHNCPVKAIDYWNFTKNKGQYYFEHNRKNTKKS